MADITPEEIARAEAVLASIQDEWLQRPGVTAIDLGFKWTQGEMTGQLAIRVHVAQKKPAFQLSSEELFPKEVEGIPVDVIEATYAPQTVLQARLEQALQNRGQRFEIVPLGVSIGSRFTTAGTLGAVVVDGQTGEEMILSNWHVLAGRRDVDAGLPILQPGWIDGGTRDDNIIAELARWVLGPYDAAVARLTGVRAVEHKTIEGRAIEDVAEPRLGMRIWKSGRSTGYTEGFIDGIRMTVSLGYQGVGTRILESVFHIVPRPGAGNIEISIGGDSGAVWVDEESGKAVGLHFAGEVDNGPEHALAHDINPVLRALKVRFPAQARPAPPTAGTPGQDQQPSPNLSRNGVRVRAWQHLLCRARRSLAKRQ